MLIMGELLLLTRLHFFALERVSYSQHQIAGVEEFGFVLLWAAGLLILAMWVLSAKNVLTLIWPWHTKVLNNHKKT